MSRRSNNTPRPVRIILVGFPDDVSATLRQIHRDALVRSHITTDPNDRAGHIRANVIFTVDGDPR